MILKITSVILSLVLAVSWPWLRQCSSTPVNESSSEHTTSRIISTGNEKYARTPNNVTVPAAYDDDEDEDDEKADIIAALAVEFLFLVVGDHLFLPPPSDREEDLQLHENARIFANLLTKLNCTQKIYALFNDTAQQIDLQSWNEHASTDRHLFTGMFRHIIEEVNRNPEMHAQFMREKNNLKVGSSVPLAQPHGAFVTDKQRNFYDIAAVETAALEKLFDSDIVKKVVITVELLKQTEEPLAEIPEYAKSSRTRLETAKGLFRLAASENMETRIRIQKIFYEALDEAVKNYELVDNRYRDRFCDLLLKKMENDDIVREEFYCLKIDLD